MSVSRDLLICGATMVLPEQTIIGDLRIRDGKISQISTDEKIEPEEGEHFVDGTGLHLLPVVLTHKSTSRSCSQKEDLKVVQLPQ